MGCFKARFFYALGYTQDDWKVLHHDLLRLATLGEAKLGQPNPHGQKYEVSGALVGPNGRAAALMSTWLLHSDEDAPRFITAYPG